MKRDSQKIVAGLIESTIKVIASEGFDKATTRNIAGNCGIADAYIYHHYASKEELFYQAFRQEDKALAAKVKRHLPILHEPGINYEDRCRFLYGLMWKHLMAYPDSCRFYIQYYYSPYYQKYSAAEHLRTWQPIMNDMSRGFRKGEDVRGVLRLVLHTMLELAIKTLNMGQQDDDETANHYFEMLYSLVSPRLKNIEK